MKSSVEPLIFDRFDTMSQKTSHKTHAMFEDSTPTDSRDSYAFYLNESSGIQFEHLARFSQPLLELFDVEPHHWRLPTSIPNDVQLLDTYSAALAAAEMFWSYFTLDEHTRKRFLPELKSYFIGAEPLPHEEADFLLLVDCMRVQWTKLVGEIDVTVQPGRQPSMVDTGNQPDLETLALFGEPLMEDPALLEDPDALEAIMERVGDYWGLASAASDDRDALLDVIVARHANAELTESDLRDEAAKMLARYDELFTNE